MKITKVFTKEGDGGMTSLIGGVRVRKTNSRIEAYGTVDELSSQLGLLAATMKDADDKEMIFDIQRNLFTVCSYLATDKSQTELSPYSILNPAEVEKLEREIDTIKSSIPVLNDFILPGGSKVAAQTHVCRAVCRRAERRIFFLAETTTVAPEVLQYMNRLSDYLFVMARKLNFILGGRILDNKKKYITFAA